MFTTGTEVAGSGLTDPASGARRGEDSSRVSATRVHAQVLLLLVLVGVAIVGACGGESDTERGFKVGREDGKRQALHDEYASTWDESCSQFASDVKEAARKRQTEDSSDAALLSDLAGSLF